jgi:hypothetical protein
MEPPMRTWTVVYRGTQREEIVEEGDLGGPALATFDKAASTGTLNGREVAGMWIVDGSSADADVIRIHGRVGVEMHARHAALKPSRV